MTQIPHRMPTGLANFIIANSHAANEVGHIVSGRPGSINRTSLAGITTLGGLCTFLRGVVAVIACAVNVHGEHFDVSPELRRKLLLAQAAIAKRLIDEIVSVYTAHERN